MEQRYDMQKVKSEELDPQFKYEVAATPGGENIKLCFACGTCTAGCPVAGVDDGFDPRKIIRQILLGMRKEILSSPVIWRCAQCYSCTAKCPQNVRFREIIKALRQLAVSGGFAQPKLIDNIEEIDTFSQKLRLKLVNTIVTNPKEYDKLKSKLEQIADDSI